MHRPIFNCAVCKDLIFLTSGFAYGLELGFMESVTAVSSIHAATDIKMPSLKNITNSSSDNHNGNSESSIISDTNLEAVNDEDSETKPDFQLRNSAIPVSNSRARKWCNEISTRARLAPDKNVDTFDFDKEVRELRALYKRCGSTVGPFRPHETMVNELSIDSIAYKSNEW